MDARMRARVKEIVEGLAREYQRELATAGTLMELEGLTCQIGDEFTRQMTEKELVRRSLDCPDQPADCPDCGQSCLPNCEPEPTLLKGLRGDLAYEQPKHFCDRCRRSFFPSGGAVGDSGAEHRHDQGLAKSGLGRRQQRQLPTGRCRAGRID